MAQIFSRQYFFSALSSVPENELKSTRILRIFSRIVRTRTRYKRAFVSLQWFSGVQLHRADKLAPVTAVVHTIRCKSLGKVVFHSSYVPTTYTLKRLNRARATETRTERRTKRGGNKSYANNKKTYKRRLNVLTPTGNPRDYCRAQMGWEITRNVTQAVEMLIFTSRVLGETRLWHLKDHINARRTRPRAHQIYFILYLYNLLCILISLPSWMSRGEWFIPKQAVC